jgi:hypothetical protein
VRGVSKPSDGGRRTASMMGDGEARSREDVKKKDNWEVCQETVTFRRIVLEREWISVTSGGCGSRET